MPFYIPVLLGSTREGRVSDKAATYVADLLKMRGVETEVVDPRILHTGVSMERTSPKPWANKVARMDALVIVTPEYNHGYPGELKEVIDSCYHEYYGKPIAIFGTSGGGLGGARCVEQLRQVVIELAMTPIKSAVYFSNHMSLWNEDGSIKDSSYAGRINAAFDELLWYAQTLKEGREHRPFPLKRA